jgi:hypothetical protein
MKYSKKIGAQIYKSVEKAKKYYFFDPLASSAEVIIFLIMHYIQ